MTPTGIVRKVDELGRIVLPVELRRTFEINEKDSLEIFTEGESIILRKYVRGCSICGNTEHVVDFKGKPVCTICIGEMFDEFGGRK